MKTPIIKKCGKFHFALTETDIPVYKPMFLSGYDFKDGEPHTYRSYRDFGRGHGLLSTPYDYDILSPIHIPQPGDIIYSDYLCLIPDYRIGTPFIPAGLLVSYSESDFPDFYCPGDMSYQALIQPDTVWQCMVPRGSYLLQSKLTRILCSNKLTFIKALYSWPNQI